MLSFKSHPLRVYLIKDDFRNLIFLCFDLLKNIFKKSQKQDCLISSLIFC